VLVQPGYEDTWYYLWRERRLPVNVDPFDARLDDELERMRGCAASSARGWTPWSAICCRSSANGQVGTAGPAWITGPWFLRDERLYLMPGDSPMGYRLPLDSLPWASAGDRPGSGAWCSKQDPFARQRRCPARRRCAAVQAGWLATRTAGGFAEGGAVALQGGAFPDGDGLGPPPAL
jgi:uncharacterized protein (DUF2126 family)